MEGVWIEFAKEGISKVLLFIPAVFGRRHDIVGVAVRHRVARNFAAGPAYQTYQLNLDLFSPKASDGRCRLSPTRPNQAPTGDLRAFELVAVYLL